MDSDKSKLFSLAQSAGKAAADLLDKTKEAAQTFADEHDLNEMDADGIAQAADKAWRTVGKKATSLYANVKEGGSQLGEKLAQAKREADLRILQPIFAEDLSTPDFTMSRLIRLTRMDRRRAASDACRGSVGHDSSPKDVRVVNLYRDHLDAFGLTFYPDANSEFYYVDPSDRTTYIALDEYFQYMKTARIMELQKLAQDLGAKHFRVVYKEEKRTLTRKTGDAKLAAKAFGTASADYERADSFYSSAEIAAEMDLAGHPPVQPSLAYLRKDPSVRSLIELRMSPNPVTHQKVVIKLGSSSGMKESEAAKIDAALGAMKCAGNTTVLSEAQSESRRYLEYEIDF